MHVTTTGRGRGAVSRRTVYCTAASEVPRSTERVGQPEGAPYRRLPSSACRCRRERRACMAALSVCARICQATLAARRPSDERAERQFAGCRQLAACAKALQSTLWHPPGLLRLRGCHCKGGHARTGGARAQGARRQRAICSGVWLRRARNPAASGGAPGSRGRVQFRRVVPWHSGESSLG